MGNGEEICIFEDPWLPSDENPRVTFTHLTLVGQKVSKLLEPGHLTGDRDLVYDLFNKRDAEIILSITLNSSRKGHMVLVFFRFRSILGEECVQISSDD